MLEVGFANGKVPATMVATQSPQAPSAQAPFLDPA